MVGVDKCILSTIQDFMQKNYTKICVLSFCGISGSNGCICWLATSLEKWVTLVAACPEAMGKLGCLCWLAASPEQWENLVVYVGLCSSRVDKNLTIIAVIEIHNSNVVELLIFEILTPNLAYAADEIFTEKMDCLMNGHWHNVTHGWFWWVCKPNNRSNAKTCMSRKLLNRNSRRTWRSKRELPAADVLETSCHDTWPASGMSKSPLRGCHKCHHSLSAPRRGAPTQKNPLIFPDCIRVQKGQTPPSLPPTQRMSRKTKHAKLMEDQWQHSRMLDTASNENYSYVLLHTTKWWHASS
jgi:hypothetical protein